MAIPGRLSLLVLGSDARTRVRISRSLVAAGVGAFGLLIQYAAVGAGMTDAGHATAVAVIALVGLSANYVAQRSGWTTRLPDPALTMPQMVFGIALVATVYAINPAIRGATTLIMAMTLVFGAFILPPLKCRQLGWLAVVALGCAMLVSSATDPTAFPLRIEAFHFLLIALVLPVIAALAGQLSALRQKQKTQSRELQIALEQLRLVATRDELTGLPNRRLMLELLAQEDRKSKRQSERLCCCLIDLDHFKSINDTQGHQAGDETLRMFARLMEGQLRAGDILARWGGEEFLLMLPATGIDAATQVVERLRAHCADPASWGEHAGKRVTFSAGLADIAEGETIQRVIARADAALYKAKASGRNCVLVGTTELQLPAS